MNNLYELAFIFLHFLLFLLNYRLMRGKLMHPAVLYSGLWWVILSIHYILNFSILDELYPVSPFTFIVLFIGALSFSLGSLIISILKEKREQSLGIASYKAPEWLKSVPLRINLLLVTIVAIGLPIYIYTSYQLFLASNLENFFVGLRAELSYGDTDMGLVKYFSSFSYFVLAIELYSYYESRKKVNAFLVILSLIIAISYALFTTGRGPFLWIATILLGMDFLRGRKFSFKKITLVISLFLIIFSLIGLLYGKGGRIENSLKENMDASVQTTGIYLVSSVNALDKQLQERPLATYAGDYTLRFFKVIAKSTNLLPYIEIEELVQEFVFVPYLTNVYTIYSPYIRDFGIYYAFLMVALFGMIQTIIYNKAQQTRNLRYSVYYSITLFPLFMSFFQDMYLTLLSTWVQIVFFTEFLILIVRLYLRK